MTEEDHDLMRRARWWVAGSCAGLALVGSLAGEARGAGQSPAAAKAAKEEPRATVPLDLYVMSHCPWGVKAENVIIPAVKSLDPYVQLRLYFIAEPQPAAAGQPARFTSMHGDAEVAENLRQVCAAKHYPDRYLDYILSRNKNVPDPNWQPAAQEAGLEPNAIEACVQGAEGAALLEENLKARTARNATSSPTIDIAGAPYAGARGPRAITLALCEALKAKGVTPPEACAKAEALPPDPVPGPGGCKPSGALAQAAGGPVQGGCGAAAAGAGGCGGGCGAGGACGGGCGAGCGAAAAGGCGAKTQPGAPAGMPPIPPWSQAFEIQVVTDQACAACQPRFMESLKRFYPAATYRMLDTGSPEGAALIERTHATRLPLYRLPALVEQADNFPVLKQLYDTQGDGYVVRPEMSSPNIQLDRPRKPRHLDVFVFSLSPSAAQAEADVFRMLSRTRTHDLTFSLHFVVQERAAVAAQAPSAPAKGGVRAAAVSELASATPGPLFSPAGEAEVQESLRQACLFQHGSMGDLFTYLACRNQNLQDPKQADTCLVMSQPLEQCINGPEGTELLRADARLVRALGGLAPPMVLWENRYGPFSLGEVGSLEALIGNE